MNPQLIITLHTRLNAIAHLVATYDNLGSETYVNARRKADGELEGAKEALRKAGMSPEQVEAEIAKWQQEYLATL